MTLQAFYVPVSVPFQVTVGRMRTICPAFALFLMSMMSFFSCCSSLVRSRSSSRCAFARARWCWRSRSAGVTVRPKRVSCRYGLE